jgi:long-chain acyl-CoA synthetase
VAANLADHVRASARRRGAAPALVHVPATGDRGGVAAARRLSWQQLDADVDAAAAGLRHTLRLRPGDRVALVLSNTPAFVTAYFGALRAGLVAVPLNTGYPAPELARLLAEADARAVLCEDSTTAAVECAVAGTHRAVVDPAGLDAVLAGARSAGPVQPGAGGEDLAVLMFTSGTSGRPRGAMLSHRALLANLAQCAALEPAPVRADDVVLLALPLSHIYALNAGLGMVAQAGASAVLAERFDPVETLAVVRSEGVTSIPGVPAMYLAWSGQPGLRAALAGVRLLACGAAPLPPVVHDQLRTRTGHVVHEGYGLTEAAPVVTSTLAARRPRPGTVGRPVPGVQVRLVGDDRTDVAEGDPGELWVRGDNLFSGYWPDGSDGPDRDGWFATGDVALADDEGDLVLVDRRKELVLVNGFNVYPREVEEVIEEHPAVAEAAVVAVPHPVTGEAVKAFVVPRPGVALQPADVTAHCAAHLARYKRPTIVVVLAELPHSATGKVAKGRLRALGHLAGPDAPARPGGGAA